MLHPNESKAYYLGVGILPVIGVFFDLWDFQARNQGPVVHLPQVKTR